LTLTRNKKSRSFEYHGFRYYYILLRKVQRYWEVRLSVCIVQCGLRANMHFKTDRMTRSFMTFQGPTLLVCYIQRLAR